MEGTKLPLVMSELIEIALADLEKAEASSDYTVDMEYWHEPTLSGNRCVVCAAGAVMAFSLGGKKEVSYIVNDFYNNLYQLKAIDLLRRGLVYEASIILGISNNDVIWDIKRRYDIPEYNADASAFKAQLGVLASLLRSKGL